jgi:signal transduction histidine kinase
VTAPQLPTTARIAALAILLGLLSNLALIGFIRWRTHDDAMGALSQRVAVQADVLTDIARSGGDAALNDAIRLTLGDDRAAVIALVGPGGRILAGNLAAPPARSGAGFQTGLLAVTGAPAPVEAGFVTRPLGRDRLLLSGRGFDERLTLQRTLERSLFLALFLSLVLGVAGGLLIARYVGRRIEAIVRVVDEVGEGDLTRRAAVVGDRDAFDRLSARINRMLERIAALMDELRLVTDALAHDLRSPVGRLRARIERALATDDEAQRDQHLSGVLAEADALTRMLSTMIEIGRSESLAGRASFSAVDPVALIAELAEMYEPLAEEAGVRMVIDAPVVMPPLSGHRQLLAQALSNLVDNALLHGAGGGQVTLSAESASEGWVRLAVADRGPGIAPEDRAEALRRFGRLDSSRSRPGAGLGLALAASVAHLHGGRLELGDGAPGLRATLILPLDTRRAHA